MTLRLRIDNFDTLDDGGPTWIDLDQRGAHVGRRTSMDWVLPDPGKHVSGHHFDIQFANDSYWLRDMSTNGTFFQGSHHRIEGAVPLRGGERLIVGHYLIAVELTGPATQPGDQWDSGTQSTIADDSDPWDFGSAALQPVNPLPPPAHDRHRLDDMAQDFIPIDRPMPPPVEAPKPVPMPPLTTPAETVIQPPPRAPEPAPPQPAQNADIMAAFCRGAGLAPEAVEGVDPEALMEALGKSTRLTVDEIMAMLRDRANVKQFTRGGERTMRSATGNNPMKFLADAEQAFDALFVRPRPGFMMGAEGFESALGDLRRHQAAVFAALQPALAEVLEGLSPEEISERGETASGLLAGSKRGRNWDAFVALWDEKSSAGDHGMLDLFLQAFARAYAEAAARSE